MHGGCCSSLYKATNNTPHAWDESNHALITDCSISAAAPLGFALGLTHHRSDRQRFRHGVRGAACPLGTLFQNHGALTSDLSMGSDGIFSQPELDGRPVPAG